MSSPEAPLDQLGHTPRKNRRAQLAAVVALIAAVGIAWIALSMVANDPVGLILAFGAIFLLVYCGSFLMIRRGRIRLLVLLQLSSRSSRSSGTATTRSTR